MSNTPDGINQNCAAAVGLTVHTYGMLALKIKTLAICVISECQ